MEDGLYLYRATIPNESRDEFDTALDRVSRQSGIMTGHRLRFIMPNIIVTIYEVFLSDAELLVMILSAPGSYHFVKDKEDQMFMRSFLAETTD